MTFNDLQSGNGPPLVLVHGLGGNLHSWDEIAPELGHRLRVHRYDLRGHGKAENPPGPWELADFVRDLEDYVDQHDLDPIRLTGFSLGGLISQGYTLKHPGKVKKLAIISAVAGRTEEERQKVVTRVSNLEKGDLETNIELALERWFSPEFRERHPERVAQRLEVLKSNDAGGYLNAYRVFGLGDLGEQLNRIDCPTLVMTGELDPGSNVRMARFMHGEIPDATLEILPDLRHSLLVEAPHVVAQKLNAFF